MKRRPGVERRRRRLATKQGMALADQWNRIYIHLNKENAPEGSFDAQARSFARMNLNIAKAQLKRKFGGTEGKIVLNALRGLSGTSKDYETAIKNYMNEALTNPEKRSISGISDLVSIQTKWKTEKGRIAALTRYIDILDNFLNASSRIMNLANNQILSSTPDGEITAQAKPIALAATNLKNITSFRNQLYQARQQIETTGDSSGIKFSWNGDIFTTSLKPKKGETSKKIGNVIGGAMSSVIGALNEYVGAAVGMEEIEKQLEKSFKKEITTKSDFIRTNIKYTGQDIQRTFGDFISRPDILNNIGVKGDSALQIAIGDKFLTVTLSSKAWDKEAAGGDWNRSYGRTGMAFAQMLAEERNTQAVNIIVNNIVHEWDHTGKSVAALRYLARKWMRNYIGADVDILQYPNGIVLIDDFYADVLNNTESYYLGLEFPQGKLNNKMFEPEAGLNRKFALERSNALLDVIYKAGTRLLK